MSEVKENKLIKLLTDEQKALAVERDEFLGLINVDPPKEWVQDHPFARGVKYLPIERVEWLLTRLFQEWYPEIRETKQLLNSLVCTVRVHYKDPLTGDWRWADGIGAVPAKTEKGSRASDMASILSDAVQTGLPAAKSFAIKDAVEPLGKIFGGDLNRKAKLGFSPSYGTDDVKKEMDSKKEALRKKLQEA